MTKHHAVLTSLERAALQTGKPIAQITAESRARFDAILKGLAARDEAEFSVAVQLGIVEPADPRISVRTLRARLRGTTAPRDTPPMSVLPDRLQCGTIPPASRTGSRSLFRSVLPSVGSAFSSLRGWLRNPTVAGRVSAASRRPKARSTPAEQKEGA